MPAWFKRFGTEIAVTDRRAIYKTGLVQRDTTEINMAKIESVDVRQSMIGRFFGFEHRPRDVLDLLLAPILEEGGNLIPDLLINLPRDAEASATCSSRAATFTPSP